MSKADDLWPLFGDECIWECYKHKKNCFLRLTFLCVSGNEKKKKIFCFIINMSMLHIIHESSTSTYIHIAVRAIKIYFIYVFSFLSFQDT
jgi:hypothetical protein